MMDIVNTSYTFEQMGEFSWPQLSELRTALRESLVVEIQKRNAIKAEIMFLQSEIKKYQEEEDK